jgi:hypothetical protein
VEREGLVSLNALQIALLLVSGLIAGFVNTLAGGGSLLTIPALIFCGLPSNMANATNRVAVLMQSVAGSASFYRERQLNLREAAGLGVPSLLGSLAGALVASRIPAAIFDPILGLLLIAIGATLFVKPRRREGDAPAAPAPRVAVFVTFAAIGFYGGFIQAGVGFFLIAAITWSFGHNLVRTNALKMAAALMYQVVSLAVFTGAGQIMWLPGLVLAAGNVAGALLGVRFAIRRGAAAVRWVIVAAVVASALKLFKVF